MKIFLINGSPRGQNSNSLKLSYEFINGIKNISKDIQMTMISILVRDNRV